MLPKAKEENALLLNEQAIANAISEYYLSEGYVVTHVMFMLDGAIDGGIRQLKAVLILAPDPDAPELDTTADPGSSTATQLLKGAENA